MAWWGSGGAAGGVSGAAMKETGTTKTKNVIRHRAKHKKNTMTTTKKKRGKGRGRMT
jgi:hypothetical protein